MLPRSGNCLSAEEGGQAAHLTSAVLADEGNHGGCWSGPLLDQLPDKEEVPYGGDGASEVLVSAPTGFFAGSPTCVDLSIKFQSAEDDALCPTTDRGVIATILVARGEGRRRYHHDWDWVKKS